MNKDYTKLYDTDLGVNGRRKTLGKSGEWHNCWPLLYYGAYHSIRDAWNVLWLKADGVYVDNRQ